MFQIRDIFIRSNPQIRNLDNGSGSCSFRQWPPKNKLFFHLSLRAYNSLKVNTYKSVFKDSRDRIRINLFRTVSGIFGWIPIRIRIQSGSRVLMTKYWNKYKLEFFFTFFLWKIVISYSLEFQKERPSYKRSLQSSRKIIQHFKKSNLLIFTIFVGHFALLDPDPDLYPLTW